jgi:Na+/citrate or Na+/malate symporter
LLPAPVIKSVTDFTKQSNFLYLFICCIIVGSILGMQRDVLIKGFLKVFVPLITGSIAAAVVGTMVGWSLGLGAIHTLFYIVVPIMGGGVGEGALPLSLGYATVTHQPQGVIFATIIPAVMLGGLTAIIFAGALNYLGKRYPHLTGEGRLQPSEHGDALANAEIAEEERPTNQPITAATVAAAGLTAITLYLVGMMVQDLTGFPAPVLMLFTAVALKLLRAISTTLREGAGVVYRFFAQVVTYPLLFAIGIALTPWDALVATLRPEILITIVSTVGTIMGTGFVVGRWVNLYPIESAIVNACHSGQGGTGDVAILTAANRMELIPFAQIATRIGGAITVTIAISAVAWFIYRFWSAGSQETGAPIIAALMRGTVPLPTLALVPQTGDQIECLQDRSRLEVAAEGTIEHGTQLPRAINVAERPVHLEAEIVIAPRQRQGIGLHCQIHIGQRQLVRFLAVFD